MFEKITLGSPSPLEGSEAKNCKIRRHPALGLEHSLFVRGTSQVDYVSFAIARISDSFAASLSERHRYEKRKAPRDDRPAEFQYCLRSWLSRQPRRMGTPHGSSCEAVNDLNYCRHQEAQTALIRACPLKFKKC
jgi:hypothetical protein